MVVIYKYIILLFFSFNLLLPKNSIHVITTNDMHGFINEQKANFINPNFPPTIIGAAGYIEYVNNLRSSLDEEFLILDGGNFFQGHPLGITDKGRTMIDWMNIVEYDAIVPGNNDFLFGVDNLIELSKYADFDFLSCNLYYRDSNRLIFKPYKIIDFKNVKVGIIGLVNPDLNNLVLSSNLKNVILKNPIEALDNAVLELKDQADIIILLTSAGVPWDREEVYSDFITLINSGPIEKLELNAIELGYFAKDIDIIVSGGISKGYNTPWYDPNSHVYTFQNYGNGTSFGHFAINFDEQTKLFSGFEYQVKNSVSQTLFLHDFDYDESSHIWIKEKFDNAVLQVYSDIDWSNTVNSDDGSLSSRDIRLNNWNVPNMDVKNNLDIITWNCEFFPTAGDSTITALSEIILDLDADIIAFQEIKQRGWFSKLMENLSKYDFVISQQSSFMDQAVIYKRSDFTLVNRIELFAEDDYNFAGRPPLKVDFVHKETQSKFSVINLHMKCCDSGLARRKKASDMLYLYLENHIIDNSNIIVLGDWNDDLKDKDGEHCFEPFLNDKKYIFPTLDITYDLTQASYPKEPYVSFLDHIMITNSFIIDKKYKVETIAIDEYMGGFDIYEAYISDHMPVYLSFPY